MFAPFWQTFHNFLQSKKNDVDSRDGAQTHCKTLKKDGHWRMVLFQKTMDRKLMTFLLG